MKKWMTIVCVTLFVTIAVFPATFAVESAVFDGTGTEEAPYRISSAQELRILAQRVNAGDERYNAAYYYLTGDVVLGEENFTPIGIDMGHAFQGIFDGGGHMISELRIFEKAEGCDHYGLFGVLNGGVVRNVTVAGYISGSPVSGGIVGLNHGGKVVNCMTNCRVGASHSDQVGRQVIGTAGGIVGINEAGGLVANSCYTNFYHNACVYGEGIVHTNREDSQVVNCFSGGETVQFHHEGEFENSYLRYNPESLPDNREDIVWYFSAYFTDESGKLTPVNRLIDGEVKKESIFWGETTLLGALNAWVDAQGNDEYQHWVQCPGRYPCLGENLIFCDYQVGDYVRPGSSDAFVEVGMPNGSDLIPTVFEAFPMMEGVSRTVWFKEYEDYPIYDILVDGESVGAALSYTFPGDGKDHTVTVRYTKAGTPQNFTPDYPYNGYPDVDENTWYGAQGEGVVREATQLGLFKGDERGHFNPDATLTVAEAVKLAAVIRDTYRGEGYPFDQTQGEKWYDTYVTYALEQGILKAGDFEDYERPATRGEMAYIFYGNGKALPEYEAISDRQAPDVPEDHPYYIETVLLYQAGVLRGSDELGTFHPDEPITRAEVAAIAVRVAVPDQRIHTN